MEVYQVFARVIVYVFFIAVFALAIALFVGEYKIARAVQRKHYRRAAQIVSLFPIFIASDNSIGFAGDLKTAVYLAVASGDEQFAMEMIKKTQAKNIQSIVPMFAQLYVEIKRGAWGEAEQSLVQVRGLFPNGAIPLDVLRSIGQAEQAIQLRDGSVDLALLMNADDYIAKMYRGKPKRFADGIIGLGLVVVIMVVGLSIASPYLEKLN